MMTEAQQKQLGSTRWKIADDFRDDMLSFFSFTPCSKTGFFSISSARVELTTFGFGGKTDRRGKRRIPRGFLVSRSCKQ
jgi:hypothetical protein